MAYNLTNLTSTTNLYEMTKELNNLVNGSFFAILMLVLFIAILMMYPNADFNKLLILDSFIISIIAFIGFILGFIGWSFLILPLILLMGSAIYYKIYN